MDTATTKSSKSSKLSELKSAIIREPLIVNAGATVMEAIALMSSGRVQCDAENHSDNHQQQAKRSGVALAPGWLGGE